MDILNNGYFLFTFFYILIFNIYVYSVNESVGYKKKV